MWHSCLAALKIWKLNWTELRLNHSGGQQQYKSDSIDPKTFGLGIELGSETIGYGFLVGPSKARFDFIGQC